MLHLSFWLTYINYNGPLFFLNIFKILALWHLWFFFSWCAHTLEWFWQLFISLPAVHVYICWLTVLSTVYMLLYRYFSDCNSFIRLWGSFPLIDLLNDTSLLESLELFLNPRLQSIWNWSSSMQLGVSIECYRQLLALECFTVSIDHQKTRFLV